MYVSHNSTPPALTNSLWIMDLGYSNRNQIEKPTQSGHLSGNFSTTLPLELYYAKTFWESHLLRPARSSTLSLQTARIWYTSYLRCGRTL